MKYKANFCVNSGYTRLIKPLEGTNLRRILKDVVDCAKAEIYLNPGNVGSISVIKENGDGAAFGTVYVSKNYKPHASITIIK